jgi:hypothetical protein
MKCFLFTIIVLSCVFATAQDPSFGPGSSQSTAITYTVDDNDPNIIVGRDISGKIVSVRTTSNFKEYKRDSFAAEAEAVDQHGNRRALVRLPNGAVKESWHRSPAGIWYLRHDFDADNKAIFYSQDRGADRLVSRAGSMGVQLGFPDWLAVRFQQTYAIAEVRLYTLQDNYLTASDPANNPAMRFSKWGITDFEVQLKNGSRWVTVPGGYVVGNSLIGVRLKFAPVYANELRVIVKNGYRYSRIVEIEAFDTSGKNVAAAVAGGAASASSTHSSGSYPPNGAINGDRRGMNWGLGDGWNDNTQALSAPAATTRTDSVNTLSNWSTTVFSNPMGKITHMRNGNPLPDVVPSGSPFMIMKERLEALGKSFEAIFAKTERGFEYWDSQGGSRVHRYDVSQRLQWIADDTGWLAYIERDALGRPITVFLGETYAIRYSYQGESRFWNEKKLVDRRDNNIVLYKRIRDNVSPVATPPDAYTAALLPGYGPIAEWRHSYAGGGLLTASINGSPYALIPFENVGQSYQWAEPRRRVFTLFQDESDSELQDRIEYDSQLIFVRMKSGAVNSVGEAVEPTFYLPRFPGIQVPRPATSTSTSGSSVASAEGEEEEPRGCDAEEFEFCDSMEVPGQREKTPTSPSGPRTNHRLPNDTEIVSFEVTPASGGPNMGGRGKSGKNKDVDSRFEAIKDEKQREEAKAAEDAARDELNSNSACSDLFKDMNNKIEEGKPPECPVIESWFVAARRSPGYKVAAHNEYRCSGADVFTDEKRVIHLCPTFFDREDEYQKALIIHEFLHLAGVREEGNDPDNCAEEDRTSHDITAAVLEACGGE